MAGDRITYTLAVDANPLVAGVKKGESAFAAFEKKVAGLGNTTKQTSSAFSGFKTVLTGLGIGAGIASFEGLERAIVGTATATVRAVKELAAYGSRLTDIEAKTGILVEAQQRLAFAGLATGTSLQAITSAAVQMNRRLVESPEAFNALGLSANALKNMETDKALEAISDKLRALPGQAQQTAAAMRLFGRGGAEALAFLKSDIAGLAAESVRLGTVLDKDTVAAMDNLDDAMAKLGGTWDGFTNQVTATIATSPGLIKGIELITEAVGSLAVMIDNNKDALRAYVDTMGRLATILTGGQIGQALKILGAMNARGPALARGQREGGPSVPEINFGAIDKLAMSTTLENVKADKKAKLEGERTAEKWARAQQRATDQAIAAWRRWQGVLDEIEKDFREMSVSIAGTPTTVGSGPMMMFGTGRMAGEGSLAGMDNVLPPGVTREQMNIALGRQAQLDAGYSKEAVNKSLFKETAEAGFDFVQMMSRVSDAFTLLGVGPSSILGKFVGTASVVAGSLDAFKKAGAGGATGLSGFLGKAVPILGIASAGFSLIKGLFGGGKSAEQKEAERQKAEQDRQRIQSAARQMRTQSIDQLGGAATAFFAGKQILTAEDAKRSGTLFIDAWTQVVKERGVVEAADAFSGAFQKMKADIETAGIAMPEWMKFVEGQMGLAGNEGFRAASAGSRNAAAFLGALGGAGGLSPESFRAFEQEARAQFAAAKGAAVEAGQGSEDAIKAGFGATNPLLKGLLNESMITGQALSADIQAMIEQAGITADVNVQQLDELRQIRAAVQAMAGSGGRLPGPADGTTFDRGDFGGEERVRGFATGGDITRTGLALVHKGERVLPAGKGGDTIHNTITVMASGNKQTDDELVAKLSRVLAQQVRSGRSRPLVSALADDGFARRGRR